MRKRQGETRGQRQFLMSVNLSILLITVALYALPVVHAKQTKQLVCHTNSYGEAMPKMLPAKAARAHARHGDPDPQMYYLDADEDLYPSDVDNTTFYGCSAPDERYTAMILEGLDCDDSDPEINPGATEIAGNEIDENCDGIVAPEQLCPTGIRFQDLGNGAVQDCNTNLIWLKDASCADLAYTMEEGFANWVEAQKAVSALSNETCGLTDDSVAGDWRLPTALEFCSAWVIEDPLFLCPASAAPDSLMNTLIGGPGPSVTNAAGTAPWTTEGDAFVGVESNLYWTGTETGDDFALSVGNVHLFDSRKLLDYLLVWPVRVEQ